MGRLGGFPSVLLLTNIPPSSTLMPLLPPAGPSSLSAGKLICTPRMSPHGALSVPACLAPLAPCTMLLLRVGPAKAPTLVFIPILYSPPPSAVCLLPPWCRHAGGAECARGGDGDGRLPCFRHPHGPPSACVCMAAADNGRLHSAVDGGGALPDRTVRGRGWDDEGRSEQGDEGRCRKGGTRR